MAAFLEVLTRCYRRPEMLSVNTRSLLAQTDDDWIQTILPDSVGRGVGWAQQRLAAHDARGRYLWILDDDDKCIRPELVSELKDIDAAHDPDVIMLRMDHGPRGVLPDDPFWGSYPTECHIGCSAYVVSSGMWLVNRDAFGSARYQSDLDFIQAVFDCMPCIYWHDVVASRVQRISMGMPEG